MANASHSGMKSKGRQHAHEGACAPDPGWGRAAPRVLGNSSQWFPPLGVMGGLGQRARKGGESLKTTQQALREEESWEVTRSPLLQHSAPGGGQQGLPAAPHAAWRGTV